MYHTIEFQEELLVDLQVSWNKSLERVSIEKGTRLQSQVKPYVMETADGIIEMADLFFDDGSATMMVPFAYFSFVDE